MELQRIPTIKLANLPTPLEEAPRLAQKLGLSELYIKRDDLTGFAGGGNKARKLEYDFAEIIKQGYDTVITAGGIQSNHARMTAAAARKLGLDIKLVLGGPDFNIPKGNLLINGFFNADIRYLVDDDANDSLTAEMSRWSYELMSIGKKPVILPIGGSTGLGALGYVNAIREITEQFGFNKAQIIIGVGSCGTIAGTLLGTRIFMPQARVIGISVSRTSSAILNTVRDIMRESAALIDYELCQVDEQFECYDQYFTEYGRSTESGIKAIRESANREGLLLDPIYTGKVMAGLFDLAEKNLIDKSVPVIFVHTGGIPIIFSFEEELGKGMRINKIGRI